MSENRKTVELINTSKRWFYNQILKIDKLLCISYWWLCNKLSPEFSILRQTNNIHYLIDSMSQAWLSSVPLDPRLSQGYNKGVSLSYSHLKAQLGEDVFPNFLLLLGILSFNSCVLADSASLIRIFNFPSIPWMNEFSLTHQFSLFITLVELYPFYLFIVILVEFWEGEEKKIHLTRCKYSKHALHF